MFSYHFPTFLIFYWPGIKSKKGWFCGAGWNGDIFNFCSWYRWLSACCLTSSSEQRIESFCCLKMFLSLCFVGRYLAILGCNHLDQHSHLHLPPHYWNYTRNLIINWNVVFVAQLAQTAEQTESWIEKISTTESEFHMASCASVHP